MKKEILYTYYRYKGGYYIYIYIYVVLDIVDKDGNILPHHKTTHIQTYICVCI